MRVIGSAAATDGSGDGMAHCRRVVDVTQRSMAAMFASLWRAPAAGVSLFSRSI